MNLQQLYYFLTIVQKRNYTRASEQLRVTQSTLSHSINDLERELNAPLFIRSGRSIRLTRFGEILLEHVEPALELLEGYLRYVSYHQTTGLFIAGLIGCWFSAAAAYRTIARVILDVYDQVSQTMLRGMVSSIIFPFGLLLTLDLSVLVVVTGQRTLQAVAERIPFLGQFLSLWSWIRYVLLFAVFLLFILAVLNMAAPSGTPRLPMVVSGIAAALALVVCSAVFSWFIGLSSRYSLVYGSLMSIVVLLIWLYLCGQILFLAVVFTSVWYKNRSRRR